MSHPILRREMYRHLCHLFLKEERKKERKKMFFVKHFFFGVFFNEVNKRKADRRQRQLFALN
jgi:siroheme synthase (precorrin-2 oxidase/ferrochelatase)